MRASSAWITAGSACVLLALLAMPSYADVIVRPELAAGRSMAILVRSVNPIGEEPAGLAESVRSRLAAEIEKRKRFRVVDDPSKADLVCLYVLYGPQSVERRKRLETVTVGSSVIILKGGASERWDAAPLWMRTSLSEYWTASFRQVLGSLHRELAKTRQQPQPPPVSQDSADASHETSVYVTCPEPYSCANADAVLPAAGTHWKRVDDPSRADFVLVWFGTTSEMVIPVPTVGLAMHSTSALSAFLVFRGDEPDWDEIPLLGVIRPTAIELRAPLEKVMEILAEPRIDSRVVRDVGGFGAVPSSTTSSNLFAPEAGRSVIYIAREDDSVTKRIAITLDGEALFEIGPGTYGRMTVAPGTHLIAASSDRNREELPIFIQAGAVYSVMVEAQLGGMSSRVTLKQVDRIDTDRMLSVFARD